MIEIPIDDFPVWLKPSDLYREWSKEDIYYITVREEYYKETDDINSFEDCLKISKCCNYFGLEYPESMYIYSYDKKMRVCTSIGVGSIYALNFIQKLCSKFDINYNDYLDINNDEDNMRSMSERIEILVRFELKPLNDFYGYYRYNKYNDKIMFDLLDLQKEYKRRYREDDDYEDDSINDRIYIFISNMLILLEPIYRLEYSIHVVHYNQDNPKSYSIHISFVLFKDIEEIYRYSYTFKVVSDEKYNTLEQLIDHDPFEIIFYKLKSLYDYKYLDNYSENEEVFGLRLNLSYNHFYAKKEYIIINDKKYYYTDSLKNQITEFAREVCEFDHFEDFDYYYYYKG